MEHLLEVKNLSVSIDGPAGEVQAVRDVSFSLKNRNKRISYTAQFSCGSAFFLLSIGFVIYDVPLLSLSAVRL